MDLHAHMRAWQREEDGSYKAEIEGFTLHVTWKPERPGERRGFTYEVKSAEGEAVPSGAEGPELFEEIEHAMATAEKVAHHAAGHS